MYKLMLGHGLNIYYSIFV